jgi:hypothetical protein
MADAGAETQVVEATFEQPPVQHHELTLSWYPVKDLCEQLTRNMVSANFVASFQRAERRSLEQLGRNAFMLMFHDAVMLMSISLLKALSQNPSAAGYDVCDVYAKLTLCCQWISFPDLESLRCLHRAVGHAVRGTPFGERWSDDFMPALTQARERLANGVVASPYRRIRRTDDGNPEEAVG